MDNLLVKDVLVHCIKQMKKDLHNEGVDIKKLNSNDLLQIVLAWIEATIDSGYINETISDDIYDNDTINNILKNKGAI